MNRALWISASGMESQQMLSNVIANNMANVNTTGFKRGVVHFQDLLYQSITTPGASTSTSHQPTGVEVGSGSRIAAISKDFTQGTLRGSSADLDMAVEGEGFFEVQLPNGDFAYTRAGSFHLTPGGQVVTSEGYPATGFPNISSEATGIDIAPDGTVSAIVDGASTEQGRIGLVRFANPEGLSALGHSLYAATEASGAARRGQPGDGGYGNVAQYQLESSNVQIINEMVDMIAAQRAYELISKSIRTADEMLRIANNVR